MATTDIEKGKKKRPQEINTKQRNNKQQRYKRDARYELIVSRHILSPLTQSFFFRATTCPLLRCLHFFFSLSSFRADNMSVCLSVCLSVRISPRLLVSLSYSPPASSRASSFMDFELELRRKRSSFELRMNKRRKRSTALKMKEDN